MVVPIGAKNFSESLHFGTEVFYILKSLLKKHGHSTNIGDEGGFSPNLRSNQEAIEYILLAIEKSSLRIGKDIFLAIDIAGNELYKKNKVFFFKKNYASIIETFMELTEKLVRDYPIISLEDPFCEKDFFSWKYLNNRIGKKVQLVGDDLFVTNENMLQKGIENNLANSLLIKLNQIGTVTEAINVVKLAKKNNYEYIISHRSGETEDTFISDFAVGTNAKQVKFGSLCRSERISKYNRLLRIEEEIGKNAIYSGKMAFKKFF
jgi:enolase